MLTRIVKLSILPSDKMKFINVFEQNKHSIKNFKGCHEVNLFQDLNHDNVFFTYSIWGDESELENYRKSALFHEIWKEVKKMFCDKPQAWSLDQLF